MTEAKDNVRHLIRIEAVEPLWRTSVISENGRFVFLCLQAGGAQQREEQEEKENGLVSAVFKDHCAGLKGSGLFVSAKIKLSEMQRKSARSTKGYDVDG